MARSKAGADAAERFLEFQAIVVMVSDLDLSLLQPAMADHTPTPLVSMAHWGEDRLKRLSRVRPSHDPAKEIVRTYAKVLCALEELEAAANKLPVQPETRAATSSPKVSVTESKLPANGGVVMKSSIRSRKPETTLVTTLPADRKVRWCSTAGFPKLRLALPPVFYEIMQSWASAFSLGLHLLAVVLYWMPIFVVAATAILLLTNPGVALKLLWRGLSFVPANIAQIAHFLVDEPRPVHRIFETPIHGHELHLPAPPHAYDVAPALTEVCQSQPSSWWGQAAMFLLAGEGGAALVFGAAMRGLLPVHGDR